MAAEGSPDAKSSPGQKIDEGDGTTGLIPVRYEYTPLLPEILQFAGVTVLVSTYQAGKVLALGSHSGQVTVSFCHFDRAMGLAVDRTRLAIGTRRQIHFLKSAPELGPRMSPAGTRDGCWLPRFSFYTGNVHGHELAWGSDGLWLCNTLFSTLCTLHEDFSFVPRWRPPFITELQAEDRCHLNGLAMQDGRPRFVTAMAESNEPAGWRSTKSTSGCVIDVPSGETVARGLAMPHSPRLYDGKLWVLHSGSGELGTVDSQSGRYDAVERVPGYTRGLAFAGQFAFVGLSKIRETSIFGGVPIAENRESLKCGIAVVDLRTGKSIAAFQFFTGVEEIFAIEVIPQRNAHIQGPSRDLDDEAHDVWLAPPPGSKVAPEPPGSIYGRAGA
ncbi:MAG TPA: TIGR03032 family protein [Caulifigura sp.]|nr:TIGR03032 family protein [Caulifigura sp.]